MYRRYDQLLLASSDARRRGAAEIGFLLDLRVAARVADLGGRQVLPFSDLIIAQRLGHCFTYFDFRGGPIAYIVWAYLADDTALALARSGQAALHYSEWNEGAQLWLIEVCAPYGHFRQAVSRALADLAPMGGDVRYARRTRGGVRAVHVETGPVGA